MGDLITSYGETVRRVDLEHAASNHVSGARVAGYAGVELAKKALDGDLAALDQFHELAGLVTGVSEHGEGWPVRLTNEDGGRVVFQATNENGFACTVVDAAELASWILSPVGKQALARRGIIVPPGER